MHNQTSSVSAYALIACLAQLSCGEGIGTVSHEAREPLIIATTPWAETPHTTEGDHDQDPHLARMATSWPQMATAPAGKLPYFERPIPKQVHQIWFGDPERVPHDKRGRWRAFCEQFGYGYRLWTEADLPELLAMMPADNGSILQASLGQLDYAAASDMARLSILTHLGGLYADADTGPPIIDGVLQDVAELFPLRNIAFMGEHHPRELGAGSVFVGNSFVMAAPEHPLMVHMEATVADNVAAVYGRRVTPDCRGLPGAMYLAGPYFYSRNLSGVFTIIPVRYLTELQMAD